MSSTNPNDKYDTLHGNKWQTASFYLAPGDLDDAQKQFANSFSPIAGSASGFLRALFRPNDADRMHARTCQAKVKWHAERKQWRHAADWHVLKVNHLRLNLRVNEPWPHERRVQRMTRMLQRGYVR